MIIDVHGHYTTSDDELRESIETNQLAKMRERESDLTIFSPRASFMAHHIGDFQTSAAWAASGRRRVRSHPVQADCALWHVLRDQ